MVVVLLCCGHKGELNCSSLSTRSARYGGHSIVEKPLRNAVPARWYFSTSGKGYHCISECKQCFPPKSPDLNIIENIWGELNLRVGRTAAIPTTLNQMRAKIHYEWNNLPQNYVQRYVTSVRRRCLLVVNSAGEHTRYIHGRHCRI